MKNTILKTVKKHVALAFCFSLVLLFSFKGFSQTFQKTYQNAGVVNDMVLTNDGGYIISGTMSTVYVGPSFLLKLDGSGNVLWYKMYSDPSGHFNYLSGTSVIQTLDGGYAVCGEARDPSLAANDDLYLLKTDASGNIQYIKTYDNNDTDGSSKRDWGYHIMQLPDSSFILSGITFYGPNPPTTFNGWVVHASSTGNVLWDKAFYNSSGCLFNSITDAKYLSDGNIFLTGETCDTVGDFSGWFIKIDQSGNVLWDKIGGTLNRDEYFTSQQNQSTDLISYGTHGKWPMNTNLCLFKSSLSGSTIWSRIYSSVGKSFQSGRLQITADNGMILSGMALNDGNGNGDVFLIKTGVGGGIKWAKTYGNCKAESAGIHSSQLPVLQTSDGGYAVCANSSEGIYLVKTDALGNIPDSCYVNNLSITLGGLMDFPTSGYATYNDIGIKSDYSLNTSSWAINPKNLSCNFVADFSESIDTICVGQTVSFTDLSGVPKPCSWLWNFGDPGSGAANTSTNQNGSPHTYNTAGTFTVTLTSTWWGGQKDNQTYTVLVSPYPLPSIIGTTTICNGSSTTLTAGGTNITAGATYVWSTGATTNSITVSPTTTTTYTLAVTNLGGCAGTTTVTVNVGAIPDISIAPPAQLNCSNTSEILTGSSTTSGATYQWTSGSATSTYTVSVAGTYTLTVTDSTNGCTASQSVIVTQNGSIPNITITPSEITCTNDSVVIQASSSMGGVSYQWTGGPADSVYKVGVAGNYTLTATNTISGCTSVQIVYVNSNTTAPNVSIASPTQLNCSITSETLMGSSTTAGVTYQWTGGIGTTTAAYTVNTASTYTLTITNTTNGCTSSQSVTVASNTTPPVLTASSSGDITCSNTSSTLTGTSASNTMSWNGGTLINDANPATVTAAGTYTVTATDASNGCTTTASVTVAENTGIPNVSIASPGTLTCATTSIILIGTSDTTGVTYLWTGGIGTTTSAYTVSTAGAYTLTVTNPINGCTTTASITVTENTAIPNVNIVAPNPLTCDTISITLIGSSDTTGVMYQWTGGPADSVYTVNTPATYTLTVINPNNGCATQQTVVVTSNSTPPAVIVNSTSICTGQTATLTASGANIYTWNTGENTTSITVNPITDSSYTVTGRNTANGCTATAAVTIVTTPTAIATDVTVCSGETINLTSTGGVTYSWTGPNAFSSTSQNPTITNPTVANSGTYTVTVSNGSCSDTATAMVTVNPTPSTNAGSDVNITIGSSTTLTATGGTTYIWTPTTGLDCDTCANIIATPTATTIYCVQTSIGTCNSTDCITVTVETPCPSNKDLAVPNAFSPNADGHNDDFCLRGWNTCVETFTIFIYDRWGEKVFESEEANFCWDGRYRGKIMDPAVFVYYIKATFTNDEKVVKKGNVSLIK